MIAPRAARTAPLRTGLHMLRLSLPERTGISDASEPAGVHAASSHLARKDRHRGRFRARGVSEGARRPSLTLRARKDGIGYVGVSFDLNRKPKPTASRITMSRKKVIPAGQPLCGSL